MADQDKHNKSSDEINDIEQEGYIGDLLKEIYASLDTTIERKNTAITDLKTVETAVALNTAKTGISTAQASAITANTAKTGISTAQGKQLQQLALSTIPIGSSSLNIRLVSGKTSTELQFRVTTGKTTKTGKITLS